MSARMWHALAMGLLAAGLGALAIAGAAFIRAPRPKPPVAQCIAGLRAQGWAIRYRAGGAIDARRRTGIGDYGALIYRVDAALGTCGGLSVRSACVGTGCGPTVTFQFQKRG